jgi:hypothetical protein
LKKENNYELPQKMLLGKKKFQKKSVWLFFESKFIILKTYIFHEPKK